MKRLYTVVSLLSVVVVLAMPTVALAAHETSASPAGWTWDEATAPALTDGWTWDE